MAGECRFLGEAPRALHTFIGCLFGVHPFVNNSGIILGEPFIAVGAFMGFFTGMTLDVSV